MDYKYYYLKSFRNESKDRTVTESSDHAIVLLDYIDISFQHVSLHPI